MAALLLAERVVTMLPEPGGDDRRAGAERSAREDPRYLRLLRSWEWLVPLWREGVVCGSVGGDSFEADIADVCRRIAEDDRFADLRPLIRAEIFDDPSEYVRAVADDLLKGGPDPALSLPIASALDRFAARHGACVARAAATSIAQQAEEQLGEELGSVGVPILVHASAERVLEAREVLEAPLSRLRAALHDAVHGDARSSLVRDVAREYSRSFEEARVSLTEPDDDSRVVAGTVMIALRRLPLDAVLRSSVTAFRTARGVRGGAPASTAVLPGALAARGVTTMIVRALGARP